MKRSYSLEEKLCAIGFVFQGESARSVSRRFHLGHHILYEWLESYKLQGVDGLKSHGHKKKRLSYEEKCKIVREYKESNLTLYQLSVKYGISNSTISVWVKLAERGGYGALESHKSRQSKTGKRMVKRLPKEEYEKNERLRLENLLLKKVRALVEEREARDRAIGRKPSKN